MHDTLFENLVEAAVRLAWRHADHNAPIVALVDRLQMIASGVIVCNLDRKHTNRTRSPTRMESNLRFAAMAAFARAPEACLTALRCAVCDLDPTKRVIDAVAFRTYWRTSGLRGWQYQQVASALVAIYDENGIRVIPRTERLVFIWPDSALVPVGIDLDATMERLRRNLPYGSGVYLPSVTVPVQFKGVLNKYVDAHDFLHWGP